MMTTHEETTTKIMDVALRIWGLREVCGLTREEAAKELGLSVETYDKYESGAEDLPFSFIHNCALLFGVELSDILEGESAHLTAYSVMRRGKGRVTSREQNIEVRDLAPLFRNKTAEPYWVTYNYSEEQQDKPIPVASHSGHEFDIIYTGQLKVQVGEHSEVLGPGDSIYYNSTTPHGMIAVGGEDCVFVAIVVPGEVESAEQQPEMLSPIKAKGPFVYENFAVPVEDDRGALLSISFKDTDRFNFAFDVVDKIAEKAPDKLAMLHIDRDMVERRFSFGDMSKMSSRAANYFRSLGVKKGDKVMLVLKRNYQFWISILALHKLGAIAIPATDQLLEKDFEYRFNLGEVSAIVITGQSNAAEEAEKAMERCPGVTLRIMANGTREGWHDFDNEFTAFRSSFEREADTAAGEDPLVMFFSSGTTGYPKLASHSHTYPLGHFITAKYWHCVDPDGIHFTISDTGWGKSLWGKLYGQWLCEAAVFTYDFDRFDAVEILGMFAKHNITTFCAPPTMYRFMIREDLDKFDLTSIKHATTAGEALNPEVFNLFKKATGLSIMEGFGQTETTLVLGNFVGMSPKVGSMGKPSKLFDAVILDGEDNEVSVGEVGEVCIRVSENIPCGLYQGYYRDEEKTAATWHDGFYHTGDTAWRDEDGYFWYVGRVDDLIKSSGYRIGPFEIESVIMELPYVLECGVSAVPDEIRGQIVKASVVLTKDAEPSDDLAKEIQEYVKTHTAPYKYPRIVVFRDSLPKTINGKIQRNQL